MTSFSQQARICLVDMVEKVCAVVSRRQLVA